MTNPRLLHRIPSVVLFVALAAVPLMPSTVLAATHQIQLQTTNFVRVCKVNFCQPNGTRLILNSVDVYLNDPMFPLLEHDFWAISHSGLNGVRLLINWRLLEPTYGAYDGQYISEINQVRGWIRKYGLLTSR